MEDVRDNEKNNWKRPPVGHFEFNFCKICQGLSFCDTLHLVFMLMVQLFRFLFELRKYHDITWIRNGR